MSTIVTQNIWRHHQPIAKKLVYGSPPNTRVFVDLHSLLIQGASPEDPSVLSEHKRQMGYMCTFVIDLDAENGKTVIDYDGQSFFYAPDQDFTGEDFISYRIVNCLGQSSEPKCIHFNVDNRYTKPQLIEEVLIKVDTVILHNGNSDVLNIDYATSNDPIVREIYAFNLLPNSHYTLAISGTWGELPRRWYTQAQAYSYSLGRYYWYTKLNYTPGFTNSAYKLLFLYQTTEDPELEILKITVPIGFQELGIPDCYNSLSPDYKSIYFCNLNLVLTPVGDARIYAKSSNKLPYRFYDKQALLDKGLPLPESNPSVSPALLELITKSNVVIPLVSADGRYKPFALLNGLDVLALSYPTFTRKFNLDSTRIGKDLGTIEYPVYNIGVFSNSHQSFIEKLVYIDPASAASIPDPTDPIPSPDPSEDSGPKLPKQPVIPEGVPTFETNLIRFCLSLTHLPQGENLAVVLHVLSKSAVVSIPGYTQQFLRKDDNGYFATSEYTGFVIIDTINCNYPNSDPFQSCYREYKLTANLEYLTQVLTSDLTCLPIDLSYVLGLVVVPCGPSLNVKALTTNYIPIKQNNESYTYKSLAPSLYDPIYLGSESAAPLVLIHPEQQFYRKTLVQVPSCILYLSRLNSFPYTVEFDLVDLTDLDPSTLTIDQVINRVQHPEWGVNPVIHPLYVDVQNVSICLEEHYGLEQHTSNESADKYPEVISIRAPSPIDGKTNTRFRYALVLHYKRNGASESAKNVLVKLLDSQNNSLIYKRSIYFDTVEDSQNLLLGQIDYDLTTGFSFVENLLTFVNRTAI